MRPSRSYPQSFIALAAFCLFSVAAEGARPEVRGKVGGTVELECSVPPSSSVSLHVVEWVRQGLDIPVLIKFGSYAPRVHPQYEGRVSLVRVSALRLDVLQLDDRGLYECRVLLLDKPADEQMRNGTWTLLSVTAPPTITEAPPPVVEALVGAHLSLSCVAHGNPAPTVTWLKDGSVILGVNYQDGALLLRGVSPQSAGRYTCLASNSEGNTTRVTRVKIKGPPVIVVPPKSTSLNISQNALLQCQAVSDPPNMTYVWQRDGENVHHIESLKTRVKIMVDGTLLISGLVPEDSGNYTCTATNGLLTPPTASANLTVMHPAKAFPMPQETYLPTGMEGVVTCAAASRPPLLRVDWTKDGELLDLFLYPGWTLTPSGSLFMATVNDDAAGVYTCTPYNSYGSSGPSGPTTVILQEPPSLSVPPETQYRLEAGSTLLIPCQGKEDPTIKVTWSKVDLARRSSYNIEANGSLLLQPLMKEHQGWWECSAVNRVAAVTARTQVFVLGTSPHPASALSVSPGLRQANVSWEAGFDGGSAQTFSVWVKKISVGDDDDDDDERQSWFSVPVPQASGFRLQVTGLSSATRYQFSVLSHNKLGTGPFSQIATARTSDPPPSRRQLNPPSSLSADLGSAGVVVVRWSPPDAQHPPITGFLLQSRLAPPGDWFNLVENISSDASELPVPGLRQDCVYELRLLSRRGELLSEPSPSVNVSTMGMQTYPGTSRHLELVPEPLLAGLLGGLGFMCLALVVLLGSACVLSHKRNRRRRKKKEKDEPPPAIFKCSPSIKTSGPGSPDSVLKKSLLPASNLYPTTSSASSSSSSSSSSPSPSQTEGFTSRPTTHHLWNHPLSSCSRTHLTGTSSSSPPIELISRGPDGRFAPPLYDQDALSKSGRYDRPSRVRRSVSLHSAGDYRTERPFVLSVDLPPGDKALDSSTDPFRSMTRHLPRHGAYASDQKSSCDGFSVDLGSVCSSLATLPRRGMAPSFPVLPHIRSGLAQPSTAASQLVLQMEHERERGNLSRCLTLAQEREQLERELRRLTLERKPAIKRAEPQSEDDELVWDYKSSTLPHRYPRGDRKSLCLSSSSVQWDPLPPSHPFLFSASSPLSFAESGNRRPPPLFPKRTPLRSEEAGPLTLPRRSSHRHQRHERDQAAPEDFYNSPQSTVLEVEMKESRSEARRQSSLSHGSLSVSSFHSNKYTQSSNSPSFHVPADQHACAEMSVDEPELEVFVTQPAKAMLHQRIAAHVQHGRPLTPRVHSEDLRRSASLNCRGPHPPHAGRHSSASPHPPHPDLCRAGTPGPKLWDSKRRSRSLDSRRRREVSFPTPDAWIESLSQENCSAEASSHGDDARFWGDQSFPTRKSAQNPPPVTRSTSCSPRSADTVSSSRSPERPRPNPDPPRHYEPNADKWPIAYRQEATEEAGGYLEATEEAHRCSAPNRSHPAPLRVEVPVYTGPLESVSSYSSYASSGRGSMEPASGRLSVCHLSPTLDISPEAVEESQGRPEDQHGRPVDPSQRRKASVDENYEWDAADVYSEPGDCDGLLLSLSVPKPPPCCGLPSMQCSTEEALKNCTELSLHPGHESSCSAEPEPDTVLF